MAAGDLGKAVSYLKMLIYIYTDRIGYDNGHGRRHATGIWVHDISCFHLLCADCHGNLGREMCACGVREAWPAPSPLRPPEPTCRRRRAAVGSNKLPRETQYENRISRDRAPKVRVSEQARPRPTAIKVGGLFADGKKRKEKKKVDSLESVTHFTT